MAHDRPIMRSAARLALYALVLGCLAGCAGDGESTGGGGGGPTGDFATIQSEIFNQSCVQAACHDSATRQGGLDLSASVSYANLVGVEPQNAVARASGQLRVTPGAPDESFLMHKLTGDLQPGEGAPMPLLGSPLSPSEIELVRSWIAAGAAND
jgi:hypothetical protein